MSRPFTSDQWALILGASSGFGLAAAEKLGSCGMSICAVHRDQRKAHDRVRPAFDIISNVAGGFLDLNVDALDADGRARIVDSLTTALGTAGRVRVLLHSIACGNVKPVAPPAADQAPAELSLAREADFEFTLRAMGTSLLTWVQSVHQAGLFAADARVIGLTSEGARKVIRGYAPVAAAKAVLESISRAIAVEYASFGIRANIIQAGAADTPALHDIPGHESIAARARERNPFGRLTRPQDVAGAVYLLALDEASWINGTVIHADGGEHLSAW